MSPASANALAAAESLSAAERRELIDLLSSGLDDPTSPETADEPAVLTEAWQREVERRSAEYDSGKAETVAWEEVRARWESPKTDVG